MSVYLATCLPRESEEGGREGGCHHGVLKGISGTLPAVAMGGGPLTMLATHQGPGPEGVWEGHSAFSQSECPAHCTEQGAVGL